jgi:hypothetical protein
VVMAPDTSARRRSVGSWLIVLGVAVLIWGAGHAVNAAAFYRLSGSDHLERLGLAIEAAGIILAGLAIIVAGSVYRRN